MKKILKMKPMKCPCCNAKMVEVSNSSDKDIVEFLQSFKKENIKLRCSNGHEFNFKRNKGENQ